jgi:hypothetical protein
MIALLTLLNIFSFLGLAALLNDEQLIQVLVLYMEANSLMPQPLPPEDAPSILLSELQWAVVW